MWERIERDCGWEAPRARAPSVRLLFRDDHATPALLDFLRNTKTGRMPGQALLVAEVEEEDLDEIDLWPRAGEGDWDGESREEGGPGPP